MIGKIYIYVIKKLFNNYPMKLKNYNINVTVEKIFSSELIRNTS